MLSVPITTASDTGGIDGTSTRLTSFAKHNATLNAPSASASRSAATATPPAPLGTFRDACTPPRFASTTQTLAPSEFERATAKYPPPRDVHDALASEPCCDSEFPRAPAFRFPPAFFVFVFSPSSNCNVLVGRPEFPPSGLYDAHTPLDHNRVKSVPSAAAAMTRTGPVSLSPSDRGGSHSTCHARSTRRPSSSSPVARYRVATRTFSFVSPVLLLPVFAFDAFVRDDVTTSTPPFSISLVAHSTIVDCVVSLIDAASFRASAPNQRTKPVASTDRHPPPETAPHGTNTEHPPTNRAVLPSTSVSKLAIGSPSLQETSAGSDPGESSAAKYRPLVLS